MPGSSPISPAEGPGAPAEGPGAPAEGPGAPAEGSGLPFGEAVAAVVVEFRSGPALSRCLASLVDEGVRDLIVVDNAAPGSAPALAPAPASPRAVSRPATSPRAVSRPPVVPGDPSTSRPTPPTRFVQPGHNLGYGGGANFGARHTSAPYLLVTNPDVVVTPGAIAVLRQVLDEDPHVALVGPMLKEVSGEVYPSGRDFPDLAEALGHAFVGLFWGGNPWTLRYRRIGRDQHRARDADWVSGAFFLVRSEAFWSVGGFDEGFFMYVEDVDLCWRLHRAGWRVRYEPAAEIVHEQGRSASQHPYRMLMAHHRSMWRFAVRSTEPSKRALLPAIGVGLVARLGLAWIEHLIGARSGRHGSHG